MPMTIKGIETNVQALLSAMKYNNNGVMQSRFTTVLPHPPYQDADFDGYPSICHYYAATENNYATVSQNRRIIEYTVEIWLITADTATQYSEMNILMDQVVQMFDESQDLSSTSLNLTKACDIMHPAPAGMQRVSTNDSEGVVGTIRLFCEADVAFR